MGGPSAPDKIKPSQEFQKIFNIFQGQEVPEYQKFAASEPLLAAAQDRALSTVAGEPALADPLRAEYAKTLAAPAFGTPELRSTFTNQLAPVLASGGALTPEQEANVAERSRALAETKGMGFTTGALGTEL